MVSLIALILLAPLCQWLFKPCRSSDGVFLFTVFFARLRVRKQELPDQGNASEEGVTVDPYIEEIRPGSNAASIHNKQMPGRRIVIKNSPGVYGLLRSCSLFQ